MNTVKNVYVEKKIGYRDEAKALDRTLGEMLKIKTQSRLIQVYALQGVAPQDLSTVIDQVLREVSMDDVHPNEEFLNGHPYFVLELLPGQFDQRAKATEECIQLILGNFSARVHCKKIYLFPGATAEELRRIRNFLLNPVEMQEGSLHEEEKIAPPKASTEGILEGFVTWSPDALEAFRETAGLAMTSADLSTVQDYFQMEGRDPQLAEIRVLDTYWSDHCRHTTFNTHLTSITWDGASPLAKETFEQYLELRKELNREHKPVTLMDLGTIGARYLKSQGLAKDVDESEEINACSIIRTVRTEDGEKEVLVQFKNETHNHPTEIEPYGGAATCLGGAIRDPLSGRAYVYQGMRITGSGDPRATLEETLPGKLPQRVITTGAAKGFSSYGNQIGLNTGFVEEIYHDGYRAKRMETGAVIGAVLREEVRREVPAPGDIVVLLGGRTGRDGIGGATGSSKEHHEESIKEAGAEVQKGNAVEERKLQRFFRNAQALSMIKRCNDFGAGGVSVAIGELADSLDIQLHRVPKKYQGLTPMEIALSESQERMAVVIEAKDLEAFQTMAAEENLEATQVAQVTDTGRLRMFHGEEQVVDLSREFLNTHGAVAQAAVTVPASAEASEELQHEVSRDSLADALMTLDFADQKGLVENFDASIGRNNLILPYGGTYQDTKSSGMASLIPVKGTRSLDASLMTYGFDPEALEEDLFTGAYNAVVESLAKIAALGGDPQTVRLSFQEYFRKLGTDPKNWGRPFLALLGALRAQLDYQVPAIGGKDSMSGTFQELQVPDTLISFAVTTAPKERILTNVLQGTDSVLLILKTGKTKGLYAAEDFQRNAKFLGTLQEEGLLRAVDTLKRGLWKTAVNMAQGNRIGVEITASADNLLSKDPGSFLVEVPQEKLDQVLSQAKTQGCVLTAVGHTGTDSIRFGSHTFSFDEISARRSEPLMPVFRKYSQEGEKVPTVLASQEPAPRAPLGRKPRVLIPVFCGTNCEFDLEFAFQEAGAEVKTFVFRNDEASLSQAITDLTRHIGESDILMLAGGFSAADEPDGSGKYIANVLRNPQVKAAVHGLIKERDGLILGICNGFQGLVKSGLLPYGEIIDVREDMPNLTFNTGGKHISAMVRTKIVSRNTPWMAKNVLGEIYDVPVSHGEGRFVASPEVLKTLLENGQIITQYVDAQGDPTLEGPFNPNGSMLAIEGISSPDGRVFGKMGHTERYQPGLYQNYTGRYDQNMFRAGVEYFLQNTTNTENGGN